MKKPTHYLTVNLGLDFTEVFSPERIQGVKFLLGVQSDEDVINALARNILSDIEGALVKHKDFSEIAGVDLSLATTQELPEDVEEIVDVVDGNEPESEEDSYENEVEELNLEPEQDEEPKGLNESQESYLDLDNLEESFKDKDEDGTGDGSDLSYDSYGVELVGNISDDIFKIEAFLGSIMDIFIREYSYKKTVENEIGSEVNIYSFDRLQELNMAVEDSNDDVDYFIRFKDQQGNIKFGKRKIEIEKE